MSTQSFLQMAIFRFLTALSLFFALGAIINQLSVVKDMHVSLRAAHIVLTILTILTSWFFAQTMFARDYAHDFYNSKIKTGDGGLIFPNYDLPDYADFYIIHLLLEIRRKLQIFIYLRKKCAAQACHIVFQPSFLIQRFWR
jgi:uncharacterized membrane protein